jgi:hypothetical protein
MEPNESIDDGGAEILEVGNVLFGHRSQFLRAKLSKLLSKAAPPFYSRRKPSEKVGDPGSFYSFNRKDHVTKETSKVMEAKVYLSELCVLHRLTAYTGKEASVARLVLFYAKHPDELHVDVLRHLRNPNIVGKSNENKEKWDEAVKLDASLRRELSAVDKDTSTEVGDFSEAFLRLAFLAHKSKWFPKTETFFLSGWPLSRTIWRQTKLCRIRRKRKLRLDQCASKTEAHHRACCVCC